MRPARVIGLVFGILAAVIALALVAGGAALLWAHTTQRDDTGYYTSEAQPFETDSYALVSDEVDLHFQPREGGRWVPFDDIGTFRIAVTGAASDVFVGIGPASDVEAYLAGVAHDTVEEVSFDPFEVDLALQPGDAEPGPASDQTFWVASASGAGTQTVTWEIESGEWGVVVMNADGSPGVSVQASVGVNTWLLLPIGLGVLGAALVFGAIAALLMTLALRGRKPVEGPVVEGVPAGAVATRTDVYPARLDAVLDPKLSRWLWLVKWLLAIPHYVVLVFLGIAAFFATVAAFFAILFTARYPRGLFDFSVGVMRWTWRVTYYATNLGTDRYPPFTLAPRGDYPAYFTVDYPERLSRPLVLVKWWLLAIPHYIVISIFGGGYNWWTWSWGSDERARIALGGGLIGLLALISGIALLFTGNYPKPLYDFIVGMERWSYRVFAYAGLMTDRYPPFRLDMGGSDPGSVPPPPVAPQPEAAPAPTVT